MAAALLTAIFASITGIAASMYLVINALITDPKWTSITFAVVLAGLPVYWLAFRSRGAATPAVKVQGADL